MANQEHLDIFTKGVAVWNHWRAENPGVILDLSKADLHGAYLIQVNLSEASLSDVNLSWADLSAADLSGGKLVGANLVGAILDQIQAHKADLSGANLIQANLIAANLTEVNLGGADLRRADLREADLREARLHGANLSRANLWRADLQGARLGETTFGDVDLSETKGLEHTMHRGPSFLDLHTLTRSKGRIPEAFLRGCGFTPWQVLDASLHDPDLTAEQIADLQHEVFALRTQGAQFLGRVFISYSHRDATFAHKMYERLRNEGAPVWHDKHDLVAGPLKKQVDRAIRANDTVLLVLSKDSVNSDWVEHELKIARRKEKGENRDILCPVALDDAWQERVFKDPDPDWEHLSKKNVLDFSQWATDAFETQFQKLLKGMKVYYPPKATHGS